MKKYGRALETAAKFDNLIVCKNPTAASTKAPGVINLYHTEKGFYLGKFLRQQLTMQNFVEIKTYKFYCFAA